MGNTHTVKQELKQCKEDVEILFNHIRKHNLKGGKRKTKRNVFKRKTKRFLDNTSIWEIYLQPKS